MELATEIELKEIVKVYKHNYGKILDEFLSVQSDFLSDIYRRYNKDLDAANIVLFFAKNLHEKTLRERDRDLDFNISFEKFWENHEKTKQENRKIVDIAESTGLPKETARRKVNNLIKGRVLQKNRNKISWSPPIEQRKSYNSVVDRQITQISRLVQVIAIHLDIKISKDKISSELKKHFSFFWYHYIKTQLQYLKMWQKELNDLELVLIASQRARKLYSGEDPTVERDNDKNTVIALREIGEGKISIKTVEDSAINKLRKARNEPTELEDLEMDEEDNFDKIYKGEISKSGAAILPSKRIRKIPEKIATKHVEEKKTNQTESEKKDIDQSGS